MSIVKIAVVSDLHAYDPQNTSFSGFMDISIPEEEYTKNPISGLLKLSELECEEGIDLLLCAGDLSDKANPVPLKYIWSKLYDIKNYIGAKECIATAGNHDLDSRYVYNSFDSKGMLQSLRPFFPINDELLFNKYWSKNYAILDGDGWRLLLLNSSAFHGQGSNELEHGRVSDSTIESIREELTSNDIKPLNLLLCHHHLVKMGEVFGDDYSAMDGGQNLINLLGSDDFGEWMVIHGHKHFPNIFYAAGGGCSPTIFSAGSLSGNIYQELGTKARNQFHVIEFHLSKMEELGLGVAGKIKSWDWISGKGWRPSERSSGLPAVSGFGFRGSISVLASRVVRILEESGSQWLEWNDIVNKVPELCYVLPSDLEKFIRKLSTSNGLEVTVSPGDGQIVNVGYKK